jgi:hypothetical protein
LFPKVKGFTDSLLALKQLISYPELEVCPCRRRAALDVPVISGQYIVALDEVAAGEHGPASQARQMADVLTLFF